MRRSPSLPLLSDDDGLPSVSPVILFARESLELSSSDPDIESGESTEYDSGWSDTDSDSDLDMTPIQDPVSSSGPIRSSPIIESDPKEREAHRRAKGQRKRAQTWARQRDDRDKRLREEKYEKLDLVLAGLNEQGLKVWDFMEHIFDPTNKKQIVQWQQFFSSEAHIKQLLDWWTSSSNSCAARKYIKRWIRSYVAGVASQEARQITQLKVLQTMDKKIDSEFASSFSFPTIRLMISKKAPFSFSVIKAFSTARRAVTHTQKRKERTKTVCPSRYKIQMLKTTHLLCLADYHFRSTGLSR
jgi:hypothetical protein